MSVSEFPTQIRITSGDFTAYIPKSGSAILDSLVLGGTRVAGRGHLVCTTQDQPYTEGVEQIHYHQNESCVEKVEVERAGNVRAVVKVEGVYSPSPQPLPC